ncbi:MAG TPA: hypothetical protein VFW28_05940 [Micropepsaceae bacterium]|nr:hypothetical protein [Micropepsaceae bacterium]
MMLWDNSDLSDQEAGSLDRMIQRRGFYPVLYTIVSTLMAEVSENTELNVDERFRLDQTAQALNSIIEND